MANSLPESTTLLALRSVTRARQVLEQVVTSSESFDYRKAKQGLQELQHLIRELGRQESRLRSDLASTSGSRAQVLAFPPQQRDSANPA